MSNDRKTELGIAYYQAFINVVTVFGETEIGSAEPDYQAIMRYMASINFLSDAFDAPSGEEAIHYFEEQLTQRVLDGFPVWRFLKLSPWTLNMVERSFMDECAAEEAERKRIYCCLRCRFVQKSGYSYHCNAPHTKGKLHPRVFELKKKCRYFRRDWNDAENV